MAVCTCITNLIRCWNLIPLKNATKSITQAYRILAKAGDMVGNNSVGTHTMRKTFGYTYYQATKDVATLMEIFNHSSQKTTLRYIGITEEAIENSIKGISFF